jgi:hypothetical protein
MAKKSQRFLFLKWHEGQDSYYYHTSVDLKVTDLGSLTGLVQETKRKRIGFSECAVTDTNELSNQEYCRLALVVLCLHLGT